MYCSTIKKFVGKEMRFCLMERHVCLEQGSYPLNKVFHPTYWNVELIQREESQLPFSEDLLLGEAVLLLEDLLCIGEYL